MCQQREGRGPQVNKHGSKQKGFKFFQKYALQKFSDHTKAPQRTGKNASQPLNQDLADTPPTISIHYQSQCRY